MKGRSDREVYHHRHGECREIIQSSRLQTRKIRRYDIFSIHF